MFILWHRGHLLRSVFRWPGTLQSCSIPIQVLIFPILFNFSIFLNLNHISFLQFLDTYTIDLLALAVGGGFQKILLVTSNKMLMNSSCQCSIGSMRKKGKQETQAKVILIRLIIWVKILMMAKTIEKWLVSLSIFGFKEDQLSVKLLQIIPPEIAIV